MQGPCEGLPLSQSPAWPNYVMLMLFAGITVVGSGVWMAPQTSHIISLWIQHLVHPSSCCSKQWFTWMSMASFVELLASMHMNHVSVASLECNVDACQLV